MVTVSAVHPSSQYGRVTYTNDELVATFEEKKPILDDYINGGFHVYNKNALKYLDESEMLEDSLIKITHEKKLSLYRHAGYWKCMDTAKDFKELNEAWEQDKPWVLGKNSKK